MPANLPQNECVTGEEKHDVPPGDRDPSGQSGDHEPTSVLARLVSLGRATLAERPGYRPPMHPGDGTDQLSGALAALRDEETL